MTPTATKTSTPSPTPPAGVIVDDFNGSLLGTDWEWYVPQIGPDYSLSAEPGALQLVVQPDKDHWIDIDGAPQVRRRDMGSGDWAIETYLALDDTNAGNQWQINLMAGFDRYDQQWLTIGSDNQLEVQRAGADETTIVTGISLPLYLRIEKSGSQYTFKYKQNSGDPWTTLDTQTIATPVSYVGLQVRTFYTSIGDTVLNVDYFRLERSNPPDPGPEKEIEHDEFDSPTLDADWTWYVPKAGPVYSLNAGTFRMSLPANDSFEHWIGVDEAPQLRRVDLGTGDWAIETRLENINAAGAGYWAGLEVGFDQFDQIWYAMVDDGLLKAFVIATDDLTQVDENVPLILRLEKIGTEYVFKYKYDPNEAWTVMAPKSYSATPQYVGVITRSWATGSVELQTDWSYFRIERWEAGQMMMLAPQGGSGATSLDEQNEVTQSDESDATPTPTRKPSPTPTVTQTATPPPTPTVPAGLLPQIQRGFGGGWEGVAPVSFKLPAPISAPVQQSGPITINYIYDPLYRLTEANYSTGDYYHYTYDAVGNRLTQTTQLSVTSYQYDVANRLTSVNGVNYTWDNNGNLLNDGVNNYTYNNANQLTAMNGPFGSSTFAYNGLGDRLTQNSINYTLDLNAGLTQVLNDGTNQYLYGVDRIAQVNTTTDYFLTDALGSVRQLTDAQGDVTLANAYEPYGTHAQTAGSAQTSYGFTGEYTDPSGMVYLRARYYNPNDGRFLTRDTWMGDYNSPLSLNRWNYVHSNPIMFTDPSGHIELNEAQEAFDIVAELKSRYQVSIVPDWGNFEKDTNRLIGLLPVTPAFLELAGYGCGLWHTGKWTLSELHIVKYAVERTNIKMHGKFSSHIGPVEVRMVSYCANGRGCAKGNVVELRNEGKHPPKGYDVGQNILDSNVNFDVWSVVHEFGHVWDYKRDWALGKGLENFTHGHTDTSGNPYCIYDTGQRLPGCNDAHYYYGGIPAYGSAGLDRKEDFANAFAAYVFPVETQAKIRQRFGDLNNPYYHFLYYADYRRTARWWYINSLINGPRNHGR